MKITEISIKRPTLLVVGLTLVSVMGLISCFSLNYELLPKFSTPVVTITTQYPGAAPNEVETSVTKKIEDAVASVENIKNLKSTSLEGLSVIAVELDIDASVDESLQAIQRKVNAILSDLPDAVKTPSLDKLSLADLPIMTISASAKMNAKAFYDLISQRIQPRLSRLPGVAQVNLIGGEEREIRVNINSARLQAYGLSLLQVQQLVNNSNRDFPTGKVKSTDKQMLVRLSGQYQDLDELRNLVIKTTNDGSQIRIRDLGEVEDGIKEIKKIARVNGANAIAIKVQKQSDANAVKVSEAVRTEINLLQKEYAAIALQMKIAQDSSIYTLESANKVMEDLFIAVFLVAFVMLFFLHSIRNALMVMVSIPASLIATFIGIKLMGFSLNLMSLLGLSLVIGILVDDAIVVIENITRHMEMGANRVRAAYQGVKEIGFTVTSITLVIVVVFLPISLTTGLVSNILRQFCLVVIMATSCSLLASFTIIPWLSSRFGKLAPISGKSIFGRVILGFEEQLRNFTYWITGILKWSLNHKRITFAAVLLLLFASLLLLKKGYIGTEFIPAGDRGEFMVQLELPKDASIEQTNKMAQEVENYLSRQPAVKSLITTVGQISSGFAASQAAAYQAEVDVQLIPANQRKDPSDIYAAQVKKALYARIPGVKIKTTPVNILGTANQAPIELVVTGPTLTKVLSFAKKAVKELEQVQGVTEVKLSVEAGNPEIIAYVDRDKMAALGLTLQAVGATMQTAFNGNNASKFRQDAYEYDIRIRMDDFDRKNIEDVQNLSFINDKGQLVKLAQFATIQEVSGYSQLERQDKASAISIKGQIIGRPSGSINQEFMQRLETIKRPDEVSLIQSGDAKNQGESFKTLGIALIISILMVYLIMVALYDNYIYPFVVLFSVPLSVIGAFLALALTNHSLNIFTILGLIMLIGLVAKNAILLVDFINLKRAEGLNTDEALVAANHARLRPILMTTIAMVIGMLPMALSQGGGAEWKNGLAWTLIGGLISSMFLTLIIVPVVYKMMDSLVQRFQQSNPVDIASLMTASS